MKNMDRLKQEERFLKWVNSRDDDWWEDQARIGIWDFRVMQDFFNEDFTQALSQSKKDVIELVEGMEIKAYTEADCAYNEALRDILLSLKDKEK